MLQMQQNQTQPQQQPKPVCRDLRLLGAAAPDGQTDASTSPAAGAAGAPTSPQSALPDAAHQLQLAMIGGAQSGADPLMALLGNLGLAGAANAAGLQPQQQQQNQFLNQTHAQTQPPPQTRQPEQTVRRGRRRRSDTDAQAAANAHSVAAAGGGLVAQFAAQLAAQPGGPSITIPSATQGVQWDRFVFNCAGCVTQNEQMLSGWTLSTKSTWKREGQLNFENKARENIRRKARLSESGEHNAQNDSYIDNFAAYSAIFPAVVKLNDTWWQCLSKPSLNNGDLTLEMVTKVLDEMLKNEDARPVWRGGEPIPPGQLQGLQELKLSWTARSKPFSPLNFLQHMNSELCLTLMSPTLLKKFPEDFPEFVAPANRSDEMVRKHWIPERFQERLWDYGFRMIGQHVCPDVKFLTWIMYTFFKTTFTEEFKHVILEDPNKTSEPRAKRQKTGELAADAEGNDNAGGSDSDSNFDDVDIAEFEDDFNAGPVASQGGAPPPRVLLSDSLKEDGKLICSAIWPLNCDSRTLSKLVSMIEPEAKVPQTPLVKSLMSKCPAFKTLGTLAISTHQNMVAFESFVKEGTLTFDAFEKFRAETTQAVEKCTPEQTCQKTVVQVVSKWSSEMCDKKRFETFLRADKHMANLAVKFSDERITASHNAMYAERRSSMEDMVGFIATLGKRLVFATVAHVKSMPLATPARIQLLDASEAVTQECLGNLLGLATTVSAPLTPDPVIKLKDRLQHLQSFYITFIKIIKEHFSTFESLKADRNEMSDQLQAKYHELCTEVRAFKASLEPKGNMAWAVMDNEQAGNKGEKASDSSDESHGKCDENLGIFLLGGGFFTEADLYHIKAALKHPEACLLINFYNGFLIYFLNHVLRIGKKSWSRTRQQALKDSLRATVLQPRARTKMVFSPFGQTQLRPMMSWRSWALKRMPLFVARSPRTWTSLRLSGRQLTA